MYFHIPLPFIHYNQLCVCIERVFVHCFFVVNTCQIHISHDRNIINHSRSTQFPNMQTPHIIYHYIYLSVFCVLRVNICHMNITYI